MRWGDSNSGCRWTRGRLPLLVGDELAGLERRKVERHLLSCLECRTQKATLARSLGILQTVASVSTASIEGSLWTGLERQIRESRHETKPAAFSLHDVADWLEIHLLPRLRPSPTAIALAFAGLTLLVGGYWSYSQTSSAEAGLVAAGRPVESAIVPAPAAMPSIVSESTPSGTMAQSEPARVDFDLDHGTPMGTDARGAKASY